MNNKFKIEKPEVTVGQHLLQAREMLGLSREIVAEHLCLKVCIVREIEEGSNSNSVGPTFLRGYIRSYAKLVKIPEKEILELLDKYTPAKLATVSPMQSFSLGRKRKKWESWLMKFTWLIIIIFVVMIGIWWWQGYKLQKQEISSMVEQNYFNTTPMQIDPLSLFPSIIVTEQNNINMSFLIKTSILSATNLVTADTILSPILQPSLSFKTLKSNDINKFEDRIVIYFKGRCWLEIRDAKRKILFRGMKNTGQKLELNGELPYEFNIGIPINVDLLYKGNLVDLNRFIKANRPAKFKLPSLL